MGRDVCAQIHFVPERDRLREVVALSPRQADMPSGTQ